MSRAIAISILSCIALLAGCASTPGSSAYITQAEEAFARGDDLRAFANYAYAIASNNEAAAQTALARLRGEPRLRAAMEPSLDQVGRSTVIGDGTREKFTREFARTSEVQAYFRALQMDADQQARFVDAAWQRVAVFYAEWRADQLAEEKRKGEAAAAARAADEAALAALTLEALRGARFTCVTETECRKAFSLAQIYVSTKTDMKIQLATDTIIETYNPVEAGKMGAKVIKTPGAGQGAEIVITVTCRECSKDLRLESLVLMKQFRPFVESQLKL